MFFLKVTDTESGHLPADPPPKKKTVVFFYAFQGKPNPMMFFFKKNQTPTFKKKWKSFRKFRKIFLWKKIEQTTWINFHSMLTNNKNMDKASFRWIRLTLPEEYFDKSMLFSRDIIQFSFGNGAKIDGIHRNQQSKMSTFWYTMKHGRFGPDPPMFHLGGGSFRGGGYGNQPGRKMGKFRPKVGGIFDGGK